MTDTAYDEMRSKWLATCLIANGHLDEIDRLRKALMVCADAYATFGGNVEVGEGNEIQEFVSVTLAQHEEDRQRWSSTDSDAVNVSKDSPANEHQTWDEAYIRCLEDGDITLGTPLRREIAARFRELTASDS